MPAEQLIFLFLFHTLIKGEDLSPAKSIKSPRKVCC